MCTHSRAVRHPETRKLGPHSLARTHTHARTHAHTHCLGIQTTRAASLKAETERPTVDLVEDWLGGRGEATSGTERQFVCRAASICSHSVEQRCRAISASCIVVLTPALPACASIDRGRERVSE